MMPINDVVDEVTRRQKEWEWYHLGVYLHGGPPVWEAAVRLEKVRALARGMAEQNEPVFREWAREALGVDG